MRIIKLDENNIIREIKSLNDDYVLATDEVESELGDIGQKRNEDGTFEDVVIEPTLEELKEAKKGEIKVAKENLLNAGFDCTPFGDGITHHYDYDATARAKFEKMFNVQNSPLALPEVPWTTDKEIQKTHTAEQFLTVCGLAFQLEMGAEHKQERIEALIDACQSKEELELISWNTDSTGL